MTVGFWPVCSLESRKCLWIYRTYIRSVRTTWCAYIHVLLLTTYCWGVTQSCLSKTLTIWTKILPFWHFMHGKEASAMCVFDKWYFHLFRAVVIFNPWKEHLKMIVELPLYVHLYLKMSYSRFHLSSNLNIAIKILGKRIIYLQSFYWMWLDWIVLLVYYTSLPSWSENGNLDEDCSTWLLWPP